METAGEQLFPFLLPSKLSSKLPSPQRGRESLAFAHGPACRVAVRW